MDYLIRNEILRKEDKTIGNLFKNLLEMLELAFQESMMNIDGLLSQQIKNLEKYGRFIASTKMLEEVSINDARKVVHIRYPKYKFNDVIIDKASKLRATLKNNLSDSPEVVGFDYSNFSFNANNNFSRNSNNQFIENNNETNSLFDLLSFEENQKYEERYLLSNEIQDYYSYRNYEFNLILSDFQKEYEPEILTDFQTQVIDLDNKNDSIESLEFNLSSNLNSNIFNEGMVNFQINSSSTSDSVSIPIHISQDDSSPSTNQVTQSLSVVLTPERKQVSECSSHNRLVNRSINRIHKNQKIATNSINNNGNLSEIIEDIGYCHTTSFFTVNSLE